MDKPRLRFAPSPSGFLHIGGARTALFCWLLARRHGGQFVLRIEDTNAARSTDESIEAILDSLKWLGLDWDEGPGVDGPHAPYYQSQRKDTYREHIDRLVASGSVYRCYCTKDELDAKRQAAMAEGRKPAYDRTCREKDPADWPEGEPYVLRLKAPLEGATVVSDLVRGDVTFPNSELSDQVVVRSNGDPLYNFVVVVDDATMNITHVVRGDDHLSNTPKQVQLYEALGYPLPKFAHLPMILGHDKKRLSKRHGATSVLQYRDEGYFPGAMVNFLARLGWSHGDQEIFTVDELIESFGLDAVGKSPGVWNAEKLDWVNQEWLRAKSDADLAVLVAPLIEAAGFPSQSPDALMVRRISTISERAKTLLDLVEHGAWYWAAADAVEYNDAKANRKFLKHENVSLLEACLAALEAISEEKWTAALIETGILAVAESFELKLGKIAQPLRVAITGSTRSPGIFDSLWALGREKSLLRVQRALALAAATPPVEA
jgi:glutamyl-tRNA synthetase